MIGRAKGLRGPAAFQCVVGATIFTSLFSLARWDGATGFHDPDAQMHRAGNLAAGRPYLLQPQPSALYTDRNERTLTDGERAVGELHGSWVGFDRGQPSITLELDGLYDVDRINIGFYSNPSKGIHPPVSTKLLTSIDGKHWRLTQTSFAQAPGGASITVPAGLHARYIRVALERHKWLFIDELEVFGSPAPNAKLSEPVKGIALITNAVTAYDASVDRLINLLQGMGFPYDLIEPANTPFIDLTRYQLAIIAGSSSGQLAISPAVETALVAAVQNGVNLLWIGHGIWGSFRTTDLPDAFGVRYLKQAWSTDLSVAQAQFTNLAGEAERLTIHNEVVDRVAPIEATVLSWYIQRDGQVSSIPFITEHRLNAHAGRAVYVSLPLLDLWKYTEARDTYARAEVLYWHILRLADAGIVGKHPVRDAKEGVLTIRLEDYTPGGRALGHTVRPWLIRMERLLDLLRDHDLPLNIALVPRYAHPFRNEYHDWTSDDSGIATLRRQAREALDGDGALVVHGYLHQNGRGPDDFSGDDWEMWDEDAERFLSLDEQQHVTDLAFAEITRQWQTVPKIWETPHYSGNGDTYAAAARSGFMYVTESDTKLFPNRQGYLNRVGGILLNLPETGFNYPLDPEEIKASGILKQRYILPRLVRLRAPFNFFYHNSSLQQERALKNLLASSRRMDLWKPNLEKFGDFWEKRASVEIASRLDPHSGQILVELDGGFSGLALSIRLPDGAVPKAISVDGETVRAACRRVGHMWLVEPVMPGGAKHSVRVDYDVGVAMTRR